MIATIARRFDSGVPEPMRRSSLNAFARVACVCSIGALLLCAPAIYNGYPLLFSDLLDYGGDGMRIVRATWPSGNHPPFYGVAIELLDMERSLWPVIFVQGLILTHILHVVLRTIGVRLSSLAFLTLIAGLTVFTSLPWYVSVVMPDLFGSIVILCLFLLLFRLDRLGRLEKVYFFLLSIACLLFHVSFVPVAIGILVITGAIAVLRRKQPDRPRLATAVATLLIAAALSSLVSLKLWGTLGGPPYAPPYLLAHVLVDGPGKQFLAKQCAVEKFVLCDYQDDIPNDVEEFMFRSYSPLYSSWKTATIRKEAFAIVLGTFKMFPLQTIAAVVQDGLTQIVSFNTEIAQLEDLPNGSGGSLGTEFAIRLPFVAKGYENSAQSKGLLTPGRLRWVNDLDAVVVAASALIALFQMVSAARRRQWVLLELLGTVILGILINGFVAGAAVGVFGRFGARVIWLLPFGVAASLLARARTVHRDAPLQRLGAAQYGRPATILQPRSD